MTQLENKEEYLKKNCILLDVYIDVYIHDEIYRLSDSLIIMGKELRRNT